MRLRRVTFHMTIYGVLVRYKSHKSHLKKKIGHDIFDNATTFITLMAQIWVLQPRGQLGYLNSNLMLRWDGHFNVSCILVRGVI